MNKLHKLKRQIKRLKKKVNPLYINIYDNPLFVEVLTKQIWFTMGINSKIYSAKNYPHHVIGKYLY